MKRRNMPRKRLKPSQLAILRGLLLFLVFFALDVAWEARDYIELEGSSCKSAKSDDSPPLYDTIYQGLTRVLLRTEPSGQVAVIAIPDGLSEVQQNLCRGRAYLAALTEVLADKHPAVIVIDKYFSKDSCKFYKDDEASSQSLFTAIKSAQDTKSLDVIVGEATGATNSRASETCLVHKNDFWDVGARGRGLTKLNSNREQIPLQWRVLESSQPPLAHESLLGRLERGLRSPVAPYQNSSSLALETVNHFNNLLNERRQKSHIETVLSYTRQPYANLSINLKPIDSTDVICSVVGGPEGCSESPNVLPLNSTALFKSRANVPLDVQGKVVVIGSQSAVDRWDVLGESIYGYQLQAAYIDALMSSNYLRAVSGHWIFALQVVFVFMLEAVPFACEYACRYQRWRRLLLLRRLSEFWVWIRIWPVAFSVIVFVVCLWAGFFPPLSVLIGALVVMLARIVFDRMDFFEKQLVPVATEAKP